MMIRASSDSAFAISTSWHCASDSSSSGADGATSRAVGPQQCAVDVEEDELHADKIVGRSDGWTVGRRLSGAHAAHRHQMLAQAPHARRRVAEQIIGAQAAA